MLAVLQVSLVTAALTQVGVEPDPAVRLRQLWGTNIARTRELRGLTRAQLAEQCDVTESAVGMWERGETAPRPHKQVLLCQVLDQPHGVLFPMVAA